MDRAYASGSSGSAPSVPASPSIGYPTAGNPGTGTPATKPGAWWYHMVTEELRKVIADAGLTPDHANLGQLSAAIAALINAALPAQVRIPVRQSVLGAPVDTSGMPSFLPANSASLSITSQNIAAGDPFVVAAANGVGSSGAVDRVGSSATNLAWPGLTANATNYLYVDVAANGSLTPGSTALAPTYRPGGSDVLTNGQFTFNYNGMVGKVGNGASATQVYRVFVGEAVTNASTVTSTVAYALQGRYDSGLFAVSGNTTYTKNHNLGTAAFNFDFTLADDVAGTNERPASATYNTTLTSASGWHPGVSSRNSASIAFPGAPIGSSATGTSITSGYGRIRARRAF